MDAKLDIFDIRLLALLQDDATRSMSELAREVGLSTSPCWRRIKRMQDEGIIKRQVAVLDRKALGLEFVVYTYVKLAVTTSESLANFEQAIRLWPEVVLCEMMTGAADYLIKVVAHDVGAYDLFLRTKLLATGLVADTQSRIVVATIKDATRLPLPELAET